MLGKLLKYDFKANARTMLIFSIIALSVSGACVGLKALLRLPVMDKTDFWGIRMVLGMLIAACWFAVFAYVVIMLVMIIRRYYKNLFLEEGYLTFTLPTTNGKIVTSKFLSAYVIMLVTLGIAIGCMTIMAVFPSVVQSEYLIDFSYLLRTLQSGLTLTTIHKIEFYVYLLLSLAEIILLLYFSITLGSLLAKKLKLLAAFGFFYGIVTVLNSIRSFILVVFAMDSAKSLAYDTTSSNARTTISYLVLIFMSIIVSVLCWFFIHKLLKKKLNI